MRIPGRHEFLARVTVRFRLPPPAEIKLEAGFGGIKWDKWDSAAQDRPRPSRPRLKGRGRAKQRRGARHMGSRVRRITPCGRNRFAPARALRLPRPTCSRASSRGYARGSKVRGYARGSRVRGYARGKMIDPSRNSGAHAAHLASHHGPGIREGRGPDRDETAGWQLRGGPHSESYVAQRNGPSDRPEPRTTVADSAQGEARETCIAPLFSVACRPLVGILGRIA